jgi:hypothetical protein
MKKILHILWTLSFVSFSGPALADWVGFGAAANCDVKRGIFSLAPVVKTSSEEYNVPAPPGYVVFNEKANQNLTCKLDGLPINLVISVWGPSATGMGQGAGVVIIESLAVGNQKIFPYRTNFLWQVANERVLTQIKVRRITQGYEAQYCYSDGFAWDIVKPFKDMKCGATIEAD